MRIMREGEERSEMRRDTWESLLTKKGYMRVPRALRLRRAELGLTNNEYTILLDYVDYYTYCGTENPYRHLSEVNGMSERSIRRALAALEQKGLLTRRVLRRENGRVNGVVFSLDALVRKLTDLMTKPSPTAGDENVRDVGEERFRANTAEEFESSEEDKNTGAARVVTVEKLPQDSESLRGSFRDETVRDTEGSDHAAQGGHGSMGGAARPGGKAGRRPSPEARPGASRLSQPLPGPVVCRKTAAGGGAYSPARWYDTVFARMYETAAGQPVLKGGREYRAAVAYFVRLSALNPGLGSERLFERATAGAELMIRSQMEGGVFGWMHKPPDICVLSGQAQSVDYHLRLRESEGGAGGRAKVAAGGSAAGGGVRESTLRHIERIEEASNEREQYARVFGELRGIEHASRRRAAARGVEGGRASIPGREGKEDDAGSAGVPQKRRAG